MLLKYFKDIFKISLILLLLIVAVGSVYAADSADSIANGYQDDDFELDDDFDDDDWDDDESDDDDWEDDDESDDDDDWDDDESDDDDWDDDDEDDSDEDEEDWDDDYDYTDFDYLEYKILCYLDRYGNCTDENWTESQDFLNEYQIYLSNPSNYTLNESAEGYQTYLKIYDSITSTFDDYNLTENETAYLKFLIIYYLNHYGNVSANYTWDDNESFANFTPPIYLFDMCIAKGSASSFESSEFLGSYISSYAPLASLDDVNQTSANNQTDVEVTYSGDMNIFILLLVILLMILVII